VSGDGPQGCALFTWSIVAGATLHWKVWDDDCVVFNTASGETHLLDPIPALLLRQIDAGCGNSEELFSRTATLLERNMTAELRSSLEAMLQQLDDLGLIEFKFH
jgi:PqqD family protein of HPr-rel-A system